MARLKRLTLNVLIGNTLSHADLLAGVPRCINVLAAKKDSADSLLGGIRAAVCTTRRDLLPFSDDFSLTARADELFEAVCLPFAKNARFL